MLNKLEKMDEVEYNVDGKEFRPGVMGLNNLGKTDWATSVIYLINTVREIRRFFILRDCFEN